MKAVVCKEFGPPEKLVIEDVDDRTPGAGRRRGSARGAQRRPPLSRCAGHRQQIPIQGHTALHPGRADVVYDAVGGDYAEAALRATAWRGRFLVIGFTAGIPSVPLNLTLLKGCDIRGVFYRASRTQEPGMGTAVDRDLDAFVADGKLRPLDEVPSALRGVLDRRIVGKVVVEP